MLAGECWALTAMCRWRRLLRGDALKLARSTPDAEDRAWDLVGRRVVAAEKHGRDPMLRIWDGSVIDWVSDSDTDPWVLRLPGCNHRRMAAEPMRLR